MDSRSWHWFTGVLVVLTLMGCQQKHDDVFIKKTSTFIPAQGPAGPAAAPRPVHRNELDEPSATALIIGFNSGYAPFTMLGADGSVTGFAMEVTVAVLERIGREYAFSPGTWARTRVDLKVGRIDLSPVVSISEERQQTFRFTESYRSIERVVFVHEDEESIGGDTLKELYQSMEGKSIGVTNNGLETEIWPERMGMNLIHLATLKTCFDQLAGPDFDACATSREVGQYFIEQGNVAARKVGVPYLTVPFATAFSMKTDPTLVEEFDHHLTEIREDGTYDAIVYKWFGEAPHDELEEEEQP
ncbi:MAG: transporter substrate-binding domain-containing protein [Bradymonadaceae bacterium]